jgi:type IV pilus assembly protein PilC
MLYTYKVIEQTGLQKSGEIDAVNQDAAIASLQRRGLIVVSVVPVGQKKGLNRTIQLFGGVPMRDIVIVSRQIATLFEAQVSAVKAFSLLADGTKNELLASTMRSVSQDIQGGITIAEALSKYPDVFSSFYVNMVRAGEESGKLTDVFLYLADYLDRQHELTTKTKNALIYPAFVVLTFIVVMILMLTLVIPKLSGILIDSGQQIPIYTLIVIGISNFFVKYGFLVLIAFIVLGGYFYSRSKTPRGKLWLDTLRLKMPYVGDLYKKLYLSRISDNINTMLSAGIPIVRTLEITGAVVGNRVYEEIIRESTESIKSGSSLSQTFKRYPEIPQIMTSMVEVGEETGSMGQILQTLAKFYKREVESSVDTLIGLIEPAMIIGLGLGVGFLLTSVLVPIYNIASSIQ